MRLTILTLFLLAQSSIAQTSKIEAALKQHLETLKYVQSLHDAESGAFRVVAGGKPSLRAINGAVRVYAYMKAADYGMPFPTPEKAKAFVLNCYDAKTGSFSEPGGKPDVAITSVAIMAAIQLEMPKEKLKGAMDYLKTNAKTFEEVRISAAAVEAWGVKECPFDLKPWHDNADQFFRNRSNDLKNGGARDLGSYVAFKLRLGATVEELDLHVKNLQLGQREDGGWGKAAAKTSDLETTYRVMRALYLAKAKPQNLEALTKFLAKCRNADGGYGVTPGEASSLSGVYYYAVIQKWLSEK
jgi:hypothetical protein